MFEKALFPVCRFACVSHLKIITCKNGWYFVSRFGVLIFLCNLLPVHEKEEIFQNACSNPGISNI